MTSRDEALLFLKIKSMGLTPNEYFYLKLLEKNKVSLLNCNLEETAKSIEDKIGSLPKALLLINGEIDSLYDIVDEYRAIFPKGKIPSGKAGRSTESEVTSKMKWFISNYPYNKDQIIAATKRYVAAYVEKNYMYMQNASSFIYKEDRNKLRQSSLLEAIETEDEPQREESFGIDV